MGSPLSTGIRIGVTGSIANDLRPCIVFGISFVIGLGITMDVGIIVSWVGNYFLDPASCVPQYDSAETNFSANLIRNFVVVGQTFLGNI